MSGWNDLFGFKLQWQQVVAASLVFLVFCSGLFTNLYLLKNSSTQQLGQLQVNEQAGKRIARKLQREVPVSRGALTYSDVKRATGSAKQGDEEIASLESSTQQAEGLSVSPEQTMGVDEDAEKISVPKEVYRDRSLVVISTAYTYTGNNTASGIPPRRGIIAVDPRVIPLGTRVYVEGYGEAIAADTGGAIKGKKIDVFLESRNEAIHWGRRKVVIHILK